jgi:DNA-binding CsgD family transcriptional regulator
MSKTIVEELKREIERLKKESSYKDKLIQKLKARSGPLRPGNPARPLDETVKTRAKNLKALLEEKEHRLSELASRVNEYDTTIRVIGDVWGREKGAIEARIKSNLNATVFPIIEKIKASSNLKEIKTYLKIIEDNLREMNPVFTEQVQGASGEFTPSETQVIQLIRQGKSSKEISKLLNLSTNAVAFHRSNIRKKLGLLNKKLNLMTYLRGQSLLG